MNGCFESIIGQGAKKRESKENDFIVVAIPKNICILASICVTQEDVARNS